MICPNCGFDNVPGAEECDQCRQDLTHLDRPVPLDRFEQRLQADTIRVLQPVKPVAVRPADSLRHALSAMVLHKVGAVVVLDEQDKLVGILSERDLTHKAVGGREPLERLKVADFMTPRPMTVTLDEPLVYAFHKMDVGEYRHLPVVDGETPIGMISVKGLLTYVARHLAEK
jgi:CBS domain-containing protein